MAYQNISAGRIKQTNYMAGRKKLKAKKIILYPDRIYGPSSFFHFFSLHNMQLCEDAIELLYIDDIEALQKEFGIDTEQLIGCFHYASEAIDTATIKTYKFSRPKNGAWIVFPWE